jgi:hypothetical protein
MAAKISTITSSTFLIVLTVVKTRPQDKPAGGIMNQRMSRRRYWKSLMETFSAIVSVPFKVNESFFALKVPEKLICLPPDVT